MAGHITSVHRDTRGMSGGSWKWITFLIVLASLCFVLAPIVLPTFTLRILNHGLIFAIAVLGLNIIFGWVGLIHLAQAAFMGIGAYIAAILTVRHGFSPLLAAIPAIFVTALVAAAFGFAVIRLRGHYLALATLGFNITFEIVASNWREVFGGTDGISGIPSAGIFGWAAETEADFFKIAIVVLVITALIGARLRNSPLGRAMIAVRDDEIAASTAGVSIVETQLIAFVIGSIFAAIAGILFAYHANYISPVDFNLSRSILFLAMLIVGGEGSIIGAIAGAILITFLPEWLRFLGTGYMAFFGLFSLFVLIVLPKGLVSLPSLTWGYVRKWSASR